MYKNSIFAVINFLENDHHFRRNNLYIHELYNYIFCRSSSRNGVGRFCTSLGFRCVLNELHSVSNENNQEKLFLNIVMVSEIFNMLQLQGDHVIMFDILLNILIQLVIKY